MKNKYLVYGIGTFAVLYGCTWVFNHLNAWVGIAAFVLLAWFTIQHFTKQSN